jgi:hypothetical protein
MYEAGKDDTGLRTVLKELFSGKKLPGGSPLLAFPDLLEAAREAGLWNRSARTWQARAIEQGLLNFNMRRPGG